MRSKRRDHASELGAAPSPMVVRMPRIKRKEAAKNAIPVRIIAFRFTRLQWRPRPFSGFNGRRPRLRKSYSGPSTAGAD